MKLLTISQIAILCIVFGTALVIKEQYRVVEEPIGADLTVKTLETEQDILYVKYGEYVQVKDGVAYTKDGLVSEPTLTLKTSLNTEVNVYDGPYGKGYQTVVKTATSTVYTGYGAEAEERTYTILNPLRVASSTKRK